MLDCIGSNNNNNNNNDSAETQPNPIWSVNTPLMSPLIHKIFAHYQLIDEL
jgi:hypothetical protein